MPHREDHRGENPRPQLPTDSRPPQLNGSVCGCTCRRNVSSEDGDGGSENNSAASGTTHGYLDYQRTTMAYHDYQRGDEGAEGALAAVRVNIEAPFDVGGQNDYENGDTNYEIMAFSQYDYGVRDYPSDVDDFRHSPFPQRVGPFDRPDSPDSMAVEVSGSGCQSLAGSGVLSIRNENPSETLRCVGGVWHNQGPPPGFLKDPLWLTPQVRHCHGKLFAEHTPYPAVIDDEDDEDDEAN